MKTQELTLGSKVYYPIDLMERERILWTCLVQACVINTHPPFPIFLRHKNWIGYLVHVLDLLNAASG
jgi:hypothetical protein